MEITLPNGSEPRAVVPVGEGAVVKLPNGASYGFVPTIREGEDPQLVIVTIWDLDATPKEKLGQIEAVPGGPAVRSQTSPSFGLRVLKVVKRK